MNLLERFELYNPNNKDVRYACEIGEVIDFKYDKNTKYVKLRVSFPELIDKENVLYLIENELCSLYKLNRVEISPKYSKELFDKSYVEKILIEAKRRQVLTDYLIC